MMRRTLFLYCFLLAVTGISAQKKIVLEKLRYSTAYNYLEQVNTQRLLAHYLNELTLKYRQLALFDTSRLPIEELNDRKELDQKYDYQHTDTSLLHLFIDVMQMTPVNYFRPPQTPEDSAVQKSAVSVFYLNAALIDAENHKQYDKPLYLVVKNSNSPGMGNESVYLPILPKTFVELMRAGLSIILDPEKDLSQVVVQVAQAFLMDDYLVPVLAGQKRLPVDTGKGFYRFVYNGSQQLLRQDEQTLEEEIIWKGKNARKYPDAVIKTIKSAPNHNASAFIFFRQEGRDVLNNRNYQLQLMGQLNPGMIQFAYNERFNSLMPGNHHILFLEKDTLAVFGIAKRIADTTKTIFATRIYNGVDSSSVISMTDPLVLQRLSYIGRRQGYSSTLSTTWNPVYNYVIRGKIKDQDFTIKCGGVTNSLREFYLGKQLVCITQGRAAPEKFVVFDASLPVDLLNPLLLIGFNHYFL